MLSLRPLFLWFASHLSNNAWCWKTQIISWPADVAVLEDGRDVCSAHPLWLADAPVRSAKVRNNWPQSEKKKRVAWYLRCVWKYSCPISKSKVSFWGAIYLHTQKTNKTVTNKQDHAPGVSRPWEVVTVSFSCSEAPDVAALHLKPVQNKWLTQQTQVLCQNTLDKISQMNLLRHRRASSVTTVWQSDC